MHLPFYPYKTNENYLDYEFISSGPKGHIKKVVRFSKIRKNIYNLGFGDLDEETGDISDIVVTNNSDSYKVLATVAATVNDFTIKYHGSWIIAQGSTPSRTRLYRMGISNNWPEISRNFDIFGLSNNEWEPFEPNRDYEAFLIRRK